MLLSLLLTALHSSSPATTGAIPAAREPIVTPGRDERPALRIVTVVDEDTPLGDLRLAAIQAYATAVWRPHIELLTDVGQTWAARCAPTLILRLTDRGRPTTARATDSTIGWIDFVDGEPSPTIQVSPAMARAWASDQQLGGQPLVNLPRRATSNLLERALGRAVAHEIGHYLFRSRTHTPNGLMKARFSVRDLDEHWPAAMRRHASATWRDEVAGRLITAGPCAQSGAAALD